jgi:hypothetical protein
MVQPYATPVYFGSASKDNLGDHVKMCTTAEDTTGCRGHRSQEYLKITKIGKEDHKVRTFVTQEGWQKSEGRDRNLLPRIKRPLIGLQLPLGGWAAGGSGNRTRFLRFAFRCIDGS